MGCHSHLCVGQAGVSQAGICFKNGRGRGGQAPNRLLCGSHDDSRGDDCYRECLRINAECVTLCTPGHVLFMLFMVATFRDIVLCDLYLISVCHK